MNDFSEKYLKAVKALVDAEAAPNEIGVSDNPSPTCMYTRAAAVILSGL
jgi:hypothetical protein